MFLELFESETMTKPVRKTSPSARQSPVRLQMNHHPGRAGAPRGADRSESAQRVDRSRADRSGAVVLVPAWG